MSGFIEGWAATKVRRHEVAQKKKELNLVKLRVLVSLWQKLSSHKISCMSQE